MFNWGIVGTGNIATLMVKDFKYVKEGKVISVVGTSLEKAKAFADKHHIGQYHSDLEVFLADETIDCIYVATPHNSHKEIVIKALRAGKHVLCEKPMGINVSEELEMIQVARQEKCFLMEAFWTAFLPAIKEMERWIVGEDIGKVRLVEADFSFRAGTLDEGRLFDPRLAGGALLDVGIYVVGITHMISKLVDAGPLETLEIVSQKTKSGVDGQDTILMQYAKGLSASLTCGVNLEGTRSLRVYGDHGHVEIPEFFMAKKAFLHTTDDRLDYKNSSNIYGYAYEVNVMQEDIKKGNTESSVLPLEHSLEVMRLLDLLRSKIGLLYPMED